MNGDGNPDLVALNTGTDSVRIIFGQGAGAVTPFANAGSAAQFRNYPVALTTDLINARVAIGDVAGGSVADIVVGAPNYSPPGGQVADGAIFVIHGGATLPASGTTLEVVATAPTGQTVAGTPLGAAEQRGRQIHIGDSDGVPPLDLLAGHGNLIAGGIELFHGASTFPGAPTEVYNLLAAGDLVGGTLFLANVDGVAGTDILVGARAFGGGTGLFSVIPRGTASNTAINSGATFDYAGGAGEALGVSMAVFDFDGDGNLDVLVGADGGSGGWWEVKDSPITGDFAVTGVDVRLFGQGPSAGDGVIHADINGDGSDDLTMLGTGGDAAFCLFGLQ